MGKRQCCVKGEVKNGTWTAEEDQKLVNFILARGGNPRFSWLALPKQAGLSRCGKSCRFRWINYLRPDIKHGPLSDAEKQQVIELHAFYGNRWSKIASTLPGRTGNEIKNQWRTRIKKELMATRIDPLTHQKLHENKDRAEQNPSPLLDSLKNDARWPSAKLPAYNGGCESNDQDQLLRQNNVFVVDDSDLCLLLTKIELEMFLDDTFYMFMQAREEYHNYFGISSSSSSFEKIL